MTREETIEFGKMWLQINEDAKDSDTYNFFKFSIEALEQEPILDKIKAEINTLQHRCYALTKGVMCAFCKYECEYKLESEDKKW